VSVTKHLSLPLDWRQAACGHVMTPKDSLPTNNHSHVTCPDCKVVVDRRRAGQEPGWPPPVTQEERMRDQRRQWTIEAVAGDTDLGLIDWLKEKLGVGGPTPQLHTPPRMEDERGMTDGVFIFHDAHITGCTLEVVPQLSGNVEITVAYAEDGTPEDGALFTLTHTDRADLFRALLHEFHYSPERGGPADDQV
jgi:hypothetical protein